MLEGLRQVEVSLAAMGSFCLLLTVLQALLAFAGQIQFPKNLHGTPNVRSRPGQVDQWTRSLSATAHLAPIYYGKNRLGWLVIRSAITAVFAE